MKTPHMLVGVLFAGLISTGFLSGCAYTPAGPTLRGFRIGPTVFEGVTNYPANPGSTYYFGVTNYPYYPTNSGISYFNTPVDYTTNPPAPGYDDFVTIISTNNRFVMHSVDFDSPTNTGTLSK